MIEVDFQPPLIDADRIVGNAAVRSSTWVDAARAANAALGAGSVLVPTTFIDEVIPESSSATYRFRSSPTLALARHVWMVGCWIENTAPAKPWLPQVQFTPTFSGAQVLSAPLGFGGPPLYVYDTRSGAYNGEEELTLTIATGAGGGLRVSYIALVELPRTLLGTSDTGVDTSTLQIGDPIYDAPNASYQGVAAAVAASLLRCRRVGHLYLARAGGIAFTSTTFANIWSGAAPALNRVHHAGESRRTLSCRVYASQTTAASGQVRFTASNLPSTTTVTIPLGAAAWYPDPATLPPAKIYVDSESDGTVNGLRSNVFDTIQVAGRVTATSRTLTVYGISIWESSSETGA